MPTLRGVVYYLGVAKVRGRKPPCRKATYWACLLTDQLISVFFPVCPLRFLSRVKQHRGNMQVTSTIKLQRHRVLPLSDAIVQSCLIKLDECAVSMSAISLSVPAVTKNSVKDDHGFCICCHTTLCFVFLFIIIILTLMERFWSLCEPCV